MSEPQGLDRGLAHHGYRDFTPSMAAMRRGNRIRLSVPDETMDLMLAPEEVARSMQGWTPSPAPARGDMVLYRRAVLQAPEGWGLGRLQAAP